jgi:hypothetical protein
MTSSVNSNSCTVEFDCTPWPSQQYFGIGKSAAFLCERWREPIKSEAAANAASVKGRPSERYEERSRGLTKKKNEEGEKRLNSMSSGVMPSTASDEV